MITNNFGSIIIINSFLEFKQFENWKKNKTNQQEKFHKNKCPEQNRPSRWF
jgi:hypothetical protein